MATGPGGIATSYNVGLWAAEVPVDTPALIVRKGGFLYRWIFTKNELGYPHLQLKSGNRRASRHMNALGYFKIASCTTGSRLDGELPQTA